MKTFFPNHWLIAATLLAAPLCISAQQNVPPPQADTAATAAPTSKHEMKAQQKQAHRDEKAAKAQAHAAKQEAKAQKEHDKAQIDSEKAANKAADAK